MAKGDSAWDGIPEPDIHVIEKIARNRLGIDEKDSCVVYQESISNEVKLYIITTNERRSSMRVWPGTLPTFPQSNAATTHWLQENTTVPVTPAFCSEDEGENELGLAWIIEQLEATRWLGPHVWVQMSWASKKKFVETLAINHAQLLDPKNRFKTVGSIFFGVDPTLETDSSNADVASQKRFYICEPDLTRPSFAKFTDLLFSKIDDTLDRLSDPSERCGCGCEDPQSLEFATSVAKRLRGKIAQIVPPEIDSTNDTVLALPGLDDDRLVVNRKGDIEEIINASDASTVPFWGAYQLPEVLLGPERLEVPTPGAPGYRKGYILGWKTKLRDVYLDKMETLHPGFQQRMKEYQPLTDLAWLILRNGFGHFVAKHVNTWLDEMENGDHYSLRNKVY